jgi:predicted nuclease with TOPRIM domain
MELLWLSGKLLSSSQCLQQRKTYSEITLSSSAVEACIGEGHCPSLLTDLKYLVLQELDARASEQAAEIDRLRSEAARLDADLQECQDGLAASDHRIRELEEDLRLMAEQRVSERVPERVGGWVVFWWVI